MAEALQILTVPGYPPLSLRDISPTRGEIILFAHRLQCQAGAIDAANLPPCGGDVGVADRGGYLHG